MLIDNSHSKLFNQEQVFLIRKIKNQKKWTKEEDEQLIQLAEKYSEKNWKEISRRFIKKNSLQCFSRYKRIRPGIIKGSWKKDEDYQIIDLVGQYGKSWSKISKLLRTRNGKQIRDRYINVLDPEIKKGKFTEDEDMMLIQLFHENGPKWAAIAKYYSNRTADMVKNRFHSSIKKKLGLDNEHNVKARTSLLSITSSHPLKIDSPCSIDKLSTAHAQTPLKPKPLPELNREQEVELEPYTQSQAFVNECVFNNIKEKERSNDYEESNINNLFNWNSDDIKGNESYQEENNWNSDDFFLYNN